MKIGIVGLLVGAVVCGCGDDTDPTGGSGGSGGSGDGGDANGAGPEGGSGGSGGGTGGEDASPIEGDVVRYEITADATSPAQSATMVFDVAAPGGSCISFGSDLSPFTFTFDGAEPRMTSFDPGTFDACSETIISPGEHELSYGVTLQEQTFHNLDIGFSKTTDLSGGTFTYLLSWVGGCDHFGPCDDDPSKLVHFTYDIAHPAGTTVLCPGERTADETSTRCEVLTTRAPTYSAFAWMADPAWQRNDLFSAAGVDVVFFEVPGGGLADALDVASFSAFLEWATDLFGPLPYGDELRFAGGPTAWLGFEHPANIVLEQELQDLAVAYADGLMHVAMHEVIHQWSGDAATLATPQDFAWKEAIAEYGAYVFEDEQRDPSEAAATLAYWDAISPQAAYHVRPTDEPPPPVEDFYGDVYGPGPMLLFVQLEDMIGRPAVLEGIAAFLEGGGARSVDDLRVALETASGEDLQPYFDAWVFGSGVPEWPNFNVTTVDNGNGTLTVTATQTQPDVIFPCRVEIAVNGAATSALATIDFGLDPTDAAASVTIPFLDVVTSTSVDPNNRLVEVSAGVSNVRLPVYIF